MARIGTRKGTSKGESPAEARVSDRERRINRVAGVAPVRKRSPNPLLRFFSPGSSSTPSISRATSMRARRALLWTLLAVVAVVGVARAIAPPKETTIIERPMPGAAGQPLTAEVAIATGFAQQWLTTDPNEAQDERVGRLAPYTTSNDVRDAASKIFSDSSTATKPLDLSVVSARPVTGSTTRRVLTVRAQLSSNKTKGDVVYLGVPIERSADGLSAGVYTTPFFVGPPRAAATKPAPDAETMGDEEFRGKYVGVDGLAKRFLEAYYSGGDLTFLTTPAARLQPASRDLRLETIDSIGLIDSTPTEALIQVNATVSDPVSKTTWPSNLRLIIRKTGQRWLVQSIG